MKKLSEDHYIVMDDSEIKEGDWYLTFQNNEVIGEPRKCEDSSYNFIYCRKITHSTQPESLGMGWMQSVQPLLLSEVKELLGIVNAEMRTRQFVKSINATDEEMTAYYCGYRNALEDNKEKKWTDADVIRIVEKSRQTYLTAEYLMLSIQPPTEWKVEFVDGKLKLK